MPKFLSLGDSAASAEVRAARNHVPAPMQPIRPAQGSYLHGASPPFVAPLAYAVCAERKEEIRTFPEKSPKPFASCHTTVVW